MALNKVVICGVNTSKLPLLSDEEKNDYDYQQYMNTFIDDLKMEVYN